MKCGSALGIYAPRVRGIKTIDSDLRLVAALHRAARERGVALRSIGGVLPSFSSRSGKPSGCAAFAVPGCFDG